MDANQSLVEYIKAALDQGHEPAAIRVDLSGIGWDSETIEASFKVASPPKLNIPLPPQPAITIPEAPVAAITPVYTAPEQVINSATPNVEVDNVDQHKKVVRVILTVGAILLGIGVYYFLAVHWLELAIVLRLAIIIFSILAAYGSGWYLKEISGLVKVGTALIFLGTLMYGAGIFLVGRMYGLEGYVAEGWTLWAFGAGLVTLATGIFEFHYVTIVLAIIAGFFELSLTGDAILKDPANLITALALIMLTVLSNYTALKLRRGLDSSAYDQI